MAKRCPPGVICIENITIVIVLIILGCVVLFLNILNKRNLTSSPQVSEKIIIKENSGSGSGFGSGLCSRPWYSFSNIPSDVLLNPYKAPLRDDRYFIDNTGGDPRGIPSNVPTQSVDSAYRQVGILTRNDGSETILALMGRPLFSNRDKWNFYTMTDKNNMIKLPITHKGRSCTNEYGCDNMYNGDTVYVEGYNDAFKVTMYDNNTMRYIPYL